MVAQRGFSGQSLLESPYSRFEMRWKRDPVVMNGPSLAPPPHELPLQVSHVLLAKKEIWGRASRRGKHLQLMQLQDIVSHDGGA